ncbi:pirin family protein [Azohydromonas caseinilytica]|uniref:Pirin family protein n=1 Tax=Azohydromonas caseinilytica TaxID=2728836 RepID=A0A848FJQ6_9BURK|nr:pirin family protein [Azohydromonas caseinilytica]NML18041.1 pirin family protein [Azohydromonas caseinilytica]
MITLRKSSDRGHANHGWLDSRHSFSFADYHDPAHMGFGNLRVINEDRVAAGSGFGTHGHRDMEIVSYVLDGELAHQDSMGNGRAGGAHAGVIRPGDVQRMSAGTGVLHSEFNHAKDRTTHFLQIWLLPRHRGVAPGYEQKHFDAARRRGRLTPVVSGHGTAGALSMNADAEIEAGLFDGDEAASKTLDPQRLAYVHVARGEIEVNGQRLSAGDAALLDGETRLELRQGRGAEVLVFDLAR